MFLENIIKATIPACQMLAKYCCLKFRLQNIETTACLKSSQKMQLKEALKKISLNGFLSEHTLTLPPVPTD